MEHQEYAAVNERQSIFMCEIIIEFENRADYLSWLNQIMSLISPSTVADTFTSVESLTPKGRVTPTNFPLLIYKVTYWRVVYVVAPLQ